MTTDDHRQRPLQGKVDFTLMYAVHDAGRFGRIAAWSSHPRSAHR